VTYNSSSFLEKNRDTLSESVVTLFNSSDDDLVNVLFNKPMGRTGTITQRSQRKSKNKLSASAMFKNSLLDLLDKMQVAQPHFIRCVKPNNDKKPHQFSPENIHRQLLYAGVVETTRIRRDGYAIRLLYHDFIRKYSTIGLAVYEIPVLPGEDGEYGEDEEQATPEQLRVAAKTIIERANIRGAQLGISKIFLKYYHGETLMRLLEERNKSATFIQKNVRRLLGLRELQRRRKAKLQREADELARVEREKREAERKRAAAEAAARAAEEAANAKALEEQIEKDRKAAQLQTLKKRAAAEAKERAARQALEQAKAKAQAARLEQERLVREDAERDEEERLVEQRAAEQREAAANQEQSQKAERKRLEAEALAVRVAAAAAKAQEEGEMAGGPVAVSYDAGDVIQANESRGFEGLFDDEEMDPDEVAELKELRDRRAQVCSLSSLGCLLRACPAHALAL
jgi:myosin-3